MILRWRWFCYGFVMISLHQIHFFAQRSWFFSIWRRGGLRPKLVSHKADSWNSVRVHHNWLSMYSKSSPFLGIEDTALSEPCVVPVVTELSWEGIINARAMALEQQGKFSFHWQSSENNQMNQDLYKWSRIYVIPESMDSAAQGKPSWPIDSGRSRQGALG